MKVRANTTAGRDWQAGFNEGWMFTAVNARRSSGNVAGADMAAAIIRAARNLSNRAA